MEGVTAQALAQKIRDYGHRSVHYVGGMETGLEKILGEARRGDLVLTLGAGSVTQAGEKLLAALAGRS